jgi:hypothetical protein
MLHVRVPADNQGQILNDMFTLEVNGYATEHEALTWQEVSGPISVPPLSMHTATTVHASLVVFGGKTTGQQPSGALHILGLEDVSPEWRDLTGLPGAPSARFGHGAAASAGKLFIYGGWTTEGLSGESDLYVLDVARTTWTALAQLPGRPEHGRALFGMAAVSCRCPRFCFLCFTWLGSEVCGCCRVECERECHRDCDVKTIHTSSVYVSKVFYVCIKGLLCVYVERKDSLPAAARALS